MNIKRPSASAPDLVAAVSSELTPAERRIAEEVLAEPTLLAFGTVSELADRVGSTTQIIRAATEMENKRFIVATDHGIFYKLQQQAPDKEFIIAPTAGEGATCLSCANCPWMAMNHLRNLRDVLITGSNEIQVPEDIRRKALKATQRMVDFVADQG